MQGQLSRVGARAGLEIPAKRSHAATQFHITLPHSFTLRCTVSQCTQCVHMWAQCEQCTAHCVVVYISRKLWHHVQISVHCTAQIGAVAGKTALLAPVRMRSTLLAPVEK